MQGDSWLLDVAEPVLGGRLIDAAFEILHVTALQRSSTLPVEARGMATSTLPYWYCGLQVQKTCPHASACLTCPVFLTGQEILAGPEIVSELRENRSRTLTLKSRSGRTHPGGPEEPKAKLDKIDHK